MKEEDLRQALTLALQDDEAEQRYRLDAPITRGGMAQVHTGWDEALEREVIVKRGEDRERGRREALMLAELEHPHIVPLYDLVEDDEGIAMVMRRVGHADLAEHLTDGTVFERLQRFLAICDGVGFAHSRGVLHRDLKPANVLIGAYGQVQVADWGLAMRLENGEAVSPRAAGTPGWMAPEQVAGEVLTVRTDVFALGAILQALLTGDVARSGSEEEVRAAAIAGTLDPLPPVLSRELVSIVFRATARLPADRYPDVSALRADVVAFLEGRMVEAVQYSTLDRATRWMIRHRAVLAGLGVLIGTAVAAAALTSVQYTASLEVARDEAQAQASEAQQQLGRTLLQQSGAAASHGDVRSAGVALRQASAILPASDAGLRIATALHASDHPEPLCDVTLDDPVAMRRTEGAQQVLVSAGLAKLYSLPDCALLQQVAAPAQGPWQLRDGALFAFVDQDGPRWVPSQEAHPTDVRLVPVGPVTLRLRGQYVVAIHSAETGWREVEPFLQRGVPRGGFIAGHAQMPTFNQTPTEVEIRDLATWTVQFRVPAAMPIAISPSGHRFCHTPDEHLVCYDQQGIEQWRWTGLRGAETVLFSESGAELVVWQQDGLTHRFDPDGAYRGAAHIDLLPRRVLDGFTVGFSGNQFAAESLYRRPRALPSGQGTVRDLALTADGALLLSLGDEGSLLIRDPDSLLPLQELRVDGLGRDVALLGDQVVVAGKNGVHTYALLDGTPGASLGVGNIADVAVSGDGLWILERAGNVLHWRPGRPPRAVETGLEEAWALTMLGDDVLISGRTLLATIAVRLNPATGALTPSRFVDAAYGIDAAGGRAFVGTHRSGVVDLVQEKAVPLKATVLDVAVDAPVGTVAAATWLGDVLWIEEERVVHRVRLSDQPVHRLFHSGGVLLAAYGDHLARLPTVERSGPAARGDWNRLGPDATAHERFAAALATGSAPGPAPAAWSATSRAVWARALASRSGK